MPLIFQEIIGWAGHRTEQTDQPAKHGEAAERREIGEGRYEGARHSHGGKPSYFFVIRYITAAAVANHKILTNRVFFENPSLEPMPETA